MLESVNSKLLSIVISDPLEIWNEKHQSCILSLFVSGSKVPRIGVGVVTRPDIKHRKVPHINIICTSYSTMNKFALQRVVYVYIVSLVAVLSGASAELYFETLQNGDEEYILVNLSQPFVYYTAAHDSIFVSRCKKDWANVLMISNISRLQQTLFYIISLIFCNLWIFSEIDKHQWNSLLWKTLCTPSNFWELQSSRSHGQYARYCSVLCWHWHYLSREHISEGDKWHSTGSQHSFVFDNQWVFSAKHSVFHLQRELGRSGKKFRESWHSKYRSTIPN